MKFQSSAFVSTVATTPPVTTPIFVSTASMNPTVQLSFVSRTTPIKEENREEHGTHTEEGIHHRDDIHYEIPVPFRESNVRLTNNRSQAVQRLHSLKKGFKGDTQYRAEYVKFMPEIIEKGYTRKVSAEELPPKEGKVWYLSHHGVYRPKKPSSIRVVFDCSARYQGESLNDHLLQGPDLSSKQTGVLTTFRKERVAFMAKVEKMLLQVKVKKEDQNFFSLFVLARWRLNSRTARVLHEGTSRRSWFITRMFQLCPERDGEEEFGITAAETMKKNFYVDNALKSVPTEKDAIELIQTVKRM